MLSSTQRSWRWETSRFIKARTRKRTLRLQRASSRSWRTLMRKSKRILATHVVSKALLTRACRFSSVIQRRSIKLEPVLHEEKEVARSSLHIDDAKSYLERGSTVWFIPK